MIEIMNGGKVTCNNCGGFRLLNLHAGTFTPDVIKTAVNFELERTGWYVNGDKHYCCEPCLEKASKPEEGRGELAEFLGRLTELIDEFKKREA